MHIYVCIHTHTYQHKHFVYTYVYIHVNIYICNVCMHIFVSIHPRTYKLLCYYRNTYMKICVHVYVYMYIHTYIHVYIHTGKCTFHTHIVVTTKGNSPVYQTPSSLHTQQSKGGSSAAILCWYHRLRVRPLMFFFRGEDLCHGDTGWNIPVHTHLYVHMRAPTYAYVCR